MLDALRGVAILLVVLYHGLQLPMGYLGVQLFFVLSGFLITGILLRTRARADYYPRFYWHRACRILPAYLLTIGYLVTKGAIDHRFFLASLAFAANLVPLQYGPLWSLAVEEQFYACWPSIVRHASERALVRAAVGIVALVLIARALFIAPTSDIFATWFVADTLAIGALTALRPHWMRSAWKLGLCCLPLAYFMAFRLLPFELMFASIVLWGATTERVGSRALRFFGDISYGLYLVHEIVNHAVAHHFPSLDLVPRFLVATTIAVAVCALSRWTYEAFFLSFKDRPPHFVHQMSAALRQTS